MACSAAMDITSRARKQPILRTRRLQVRCLSPGGVVRNITETTHRVLSKKFGSQAPVLVSLIGEDVVGGVLRNELSRIGTRTDGLIPIPGKVSAVWNMVLDAEGLLTDVANVDIIESLEGKAASLSPFTI